MFKNLLARFRKSPLERNFDRCVERFAKFGSIFVEEGWKRYDHSGHCTHEFRVSVVLKEELQPIFAANCIQHSAATFEDAFEAVRLILEKGVEP